MSPNRFPLMDTRALGHAVLLPTVPAAGPAGLGKSIGQNGANGEANGITPLSPEAAGALEGLREAKRVYKTVKARYGDLRSLLGQLKADEIVGQAAADVENAKASYDSALARGA